FTLAIETAGIYLGRHAGPDACRAFHERLKAAGLLKSAEEPAKNPAVAVRHRERSLGKTLAFTFETLSREAIHLLTLASLLPADSIALPWIQAIATKAFPPLDPTANLTALVTSTAPEIPQGKAGIPSDKFPEIVDLLLGLRLLQTSDEAAADGQPLIARMHRLVQEYVR